MKTNNDQFRDSRGELRAYAFACGYIEREREFTLSRTLSGDMPVPVYWVRGFTRAGEYISQSYRRLAEARINLRRFAKL